jgi:hypothetical protein
MQASVQTNTFRFAPYRAAQTPSRYGFRADKSRTIFCSELWLMTMTIFVAFGYLLSN